MYPSPSALSRWFYSSRNLVTIVVEAGQATAVFVACGGFGLGGIGSGTVAFLRGTFVVAASEHVAVVEGGLWLGSRSHEKQL